MAKRILKHVKKPLQSKKEQKYNFEFSRSDLKRLDEIWEKLLELAMTIGQVASRFAGFFAELEVQRRGILSKQIRQHASKGALR